jgi:SAM-dependent methyltransferase
MTNPSTPVPARSERDRCPVCGDASRDSYVAFAELEFVRCRRCSAIYKGWEIPDLRPADLYEASYYSPTKRSRRDRRFEHRVHKAQKQIATALELAGAAKVVSVLDVGCSNGFVMEAGQRLGLAAAGMDVSRYAIEQCKTRGYRAEVGTLERMPWSDGEFDLVLMKHVLEHTSSPRVALGEVRRVTRPAALLVVAVPDARYWKGLYRRRSYRYFRPDDLGRQHEVYYTDVTLPRLLADCGFRVVARSKAVFRHTFARRSPAHAVVEAIRFGAVRVGVALAAALLLRRELFFVARREG